MVGGMVVVLVVVAMVVVVCYKQCNECHIKILSSGLSIMRVQ